MHPRKAKIIIKWLYRFTEKEWNNIIQSTVDHNNN